ncbi:MAG: hypothetical protein NUV91_10220, partial [Candidatus Omnitrophica bacterium]|nr:hypothetical protein [Candidatus Omnitrophota bacterium]
MWMKWFPWRFIVKRMARAHGFLDPVVLLSYINRFAQPAEVTAPVELLRAGAVLHARGLINSQAIQHNLDWVWPYWVECQFDPDSPSFVPRAFSLTHINLTQRNWTAVGLPDSIELPIVDPRGLVTPFFDSWSVDAWVITEDQKLIPSKIVQGNQRLEWEENLSVVTELSQGQAKLISHVEVQKNPEGIASCKMTFSAMAPQEGWLVVSLRPFNPEGVSFVHRIELMNEGQAWKVNDEHGIYFNHKIERNLFS